jgi:hypothetical protein
MWRLSAARFGLLPLALVLLVPAAACASEPAEEEAASEATDEEPVLTGRVTREELEEAMPSWVGETVAAEIDEEAATALAAVEPGAEVTVVLGTWCSDSLREVPRFWRALDQVGGLVPFEVTYLAVDRAKQEPAELLAGLEVTHVPTFIVRRGGREVGRIVERSPGAIELDLLDLLEGNAWGVLSGSDLGE